jgi:heptosyltransferase-2
VIVLPPGPGRVVDDGAPRFRVPPGPKQRRRSAQRVNLGDCRRILVVKLDFIGDHVLTTPFLANLRWNAPRADITLAVLDRAYPFAAPCRFVDRVVTVSAADGRRITFGAGSVSALANFRGDYTGAAFDLALVPRWDIDFNGALQIALGSGAARIAGFSEFSTPGRRDFNRGEDRFYTDLAVDRRSVHEVEHKLALLEALGGRIATRSAALDLSDVDRAAAQAFVAASFPNRRPLLAVAPFVGAKRRQFPPHRLAAIVARLAQSLDLDVVIVGGRLDGDDGAAFREAVGERAVSSLGRLEPRPSAALIEQCVVFVGMDSGPAHLAAAVGTPTAVICCHPKDGDPDHHNSPVRFAPWGKPGRVLVIQPQHGLGPCDRACRMNFPHCIAQLGDEEILLSLTQFARGFVTP